MSDIHAPGGPIPEVPYDLTVPQFLLDIDWHPARPALLSRAPCMIEDATGRAISFDEVRARTIALANVLHSRFQIRDNDVVCICTPNHVDFPVVALAAQKLGAVVTASNPAYTASDLEYQLRITNAKILILHPWNLAVGHAAAKAVGLPLERTILFDVAESSEPSQAYPTVSELVKEGSAKPQSFTERRLGPNEGKTKLAYINLSSGTTGKPKAVCIPHSAVIAGMIQQGHMLEQDTTPWDDRKYRPGDRWYAALPFFHIYGLVGIMHFALFYGTTLVVVPKFSFEGMLKSIQRHKIRMLPAVPPIVVLLCKNPEVNRYDLSSLRLVMCGAAPLSAELINQLSARLPWISIGQGYGMTEAVGSVCFPQLEQKICSPGSAGRLVPGLTARVVRSDGSLAGLGELGQLVIKSDAIALGYLNNEEASKETFVDGWLYTGDEVYINDKYEVFITDRIKEILKVKGFQVAPSELEGHLLDHPDVSDVCVVGIPDEYNGELPFAFVVLSAEAIQRIKEFPAEAESIRAAVMKHVSDNKVQYKWLAGVEFVESVPKNPSGKLLRRELRDRAKDMLAKGKLLLVSTKGRVRPKL
ncbi:amp dependent CoA ligase [Rhodofomes roseus]|uniref:Amp dependent CoA ligase n=1 Tax=Rhodofomes roseus TaxID=34475 RepID=A0ABQ8KBT0_9APHY|nr:amp dependent CoA ligase [Rhodofomes roseus]KAH9834980.1 amp dependent CoA ligase [Rhodofomes roseus]